MNPLFLGLLIAGFVLVVGVLAYNWMQERRVRRRTAAAFTRPGGGREHTEPSLRGADAVGVAQSVAIDNESADADLPGEDALRDETLPQPLGVAHGTRAATGCTRAGRRARPDARAAASQAGALARATRARLAVAGARRWPWSVARDRGLPASGRSFRRGDAQRHRGLSAQRGRGRHAAILRLRPA
jgi:hypothetical protein